MSAWVHPSITLKLIVSGKEMDAITNEGVAPVV
jgi:hypothetical protein